MQGFIISLLVCSVTMSGLGLLYIAAMPLLAKRYTGKWRYYAWLVVVIGLIIPFRPQFENALFRFDLSGEAIIPAIQTVNGTPIISPAEGVALLSVPVSIPWWQIAFVIWLAGMVLLFAYRAVQHCRFVKMTARWSEAVPDAQNDLLQYLKSGMGVSRCIDLYSCSCVNTPMLIGLAKPRILLPDNNFAEEELCFILKHELVHYTRMDLVYKCLIMIATTIHWFNPIVYLIARAIGIECESSCDAAVVKNADVDTRQHYCETIIGVVKSHSKHMTAFSTNFYSGKAGMKKRIFSIMDATNKRNGAFILCAAIVSTMILSCTILTGASASGASANIATSDDVFNLSVTLNTDIKVNGLNTRFYTGGVLVEGHGTSSEGKTFPKGETIVFSIERGESAIPDGMEIEVEFELTTDGVAHVIGGRIPVTISYGEAQHIDISENGDALTATVK